MSINIASEIVHFAGHTARPPPPCRRYDLPGAAFLVSGADRCSVSSVWACVVPCMVCPGTCPALVLARSVLLPVLCGLSGLGSPPAGYIAAAQPRPVSPVTTEKIKKAQKTPPPTSKFQKIPPQKQKDPYKGAVFCAILALQALKGRNLQWLKVK